MRATVIFSRLIIHGRAGIQRACRTSKASTTLKKIVD